mgnify:CR=1 FL=1
MLAQAESDRLDALYVELAASQERAAGAAAKKSMWLDIDDDPFTGLALEQRKQDDLAQPGEIVPDARAAIAALRRVVLLGEPGAGKTTTLIQTTFDLARAAQREPLGAPLPLFVPLREFDGALSFAAFVESRMHNLQSNGAALLASGRFVLLCDALNEMPRRAKTDARDLVAEVRTFLERQPDWVVSCRIRDYSEDLSGMTGVGKLRLKPLDPPRIADFIRRKFADRAEVERGQALWAAIGFHSILGVMYAMSGQSNTRAYGYGDNWRYRLQRVSGYVGIAFIFYHVATLRWGWSFLVPSGTVWSHHFASSTLATALRGGTDGFTAMGVLVSLFYFVGITMLVFHFANGMWTAAITWGITVSQSAQRRWGVACLGLGASLMVMAWGALAGFVLLDPIKARALEDEKAGITGLSPEKR